MSAGGPHDAQLRAWLAADPWRMACLEAVAALDLPDGWIGAGFLRNLAWDRLHGFTAPTPLADVDVLVFEPASGLEREAEIEAALAGRLPAVPWSVKNQARMHLRNGDAPYRDTADALCHWLETPTAVAVRMDDGGTLELLAPLGVDDLLAMRITPTPHARKHRLGSYCERVLDKPWARQWPQLDIIIPD